MDNFERVCAYFDKVGKTGFPVGKRKEKCDSVQVEIE